LCKDHGSAAAAAFREVSYEIIFRRIALRGGCGLFLALTAAGGCATHPWEKTTAPPTFAEPFAPIDAAQQNAEWSRRECAGLGSGVDRPRDGEVPAEVFQDHPQRRLQYCAGRSQSFDYMDGSNRLYPHWLNTLETMVKAALDDGLTVILDEHDIEMCGKDAAGCRSN